MTLEAFIVFRTAQNFSYAMVTKFSDASQNIHSTRSYRQTGRISGIRRRLKDGEEIFHILDLQASSKASCVILAIVQKYSLVRTAMTVSIIFE